MTYSTFMGLETARRAMSTARTGMDVTGHNVANAGTPVTPASGPSRKPATPTPYPP